MIDIKNLHYQFGSKRKLINGLNLHLETGKIYGLLGQNGAGKSTLLKCISSLLIPQKGDIIIDGYNSKDRLAGFLEGIFFLPEDITFPNMLPETYGQVYGSFYSGFSMNQFRSICNEFEIPWSYKMEEMSYGQKKKTLIAFGIACNTRIVILDEPTNGLDITSKSQFKKIVAKYTNENNCFLISTHQIKDIENLIDHILILHEGEIRFNQSTSHIAERIHFAELESVSESKYALYQESSLHGTSIVELNTNNLESKVDLELLYKAVMNNPTSLNRAFN